VTRRQPTRLSGTSRLRGRSRSAPSPCGSAARSGRHIRGGAAAGASP